MSMANNTCAGFLYRVKAVVIKKQTFSNGTSQLTSMFEKKQALAKEYDSW